jgi:hypothetical protein
VEPRIRQQENQQRAAQQNVAAISGHADRRIHHSYVSQAGFKPDHVSEHQGQQDNRGVADEANSHEFLVSDPRAVPVSEGK